MSRNPQRQRKQQLDRRYSVPSIPWQQENDDSHQRDDGNERGGTFRPNFGPSTSQKA